MSFEPSQILCLVNEAGSQTLLKIYHVPGTRSARVLWLCDELEIRLAVEEISFSAAYRMSPEWLARNPVGKVPVLEDGEFSMFESGAMLQYILDRYGKGRLQPPAGTEAHGEYLQWCWFAEATFARPLGEIVNHRRHFRPERDEVIAEMKERVVLCINAVNEALRDRAFITGEFSAADIMLGYCLMLCERLVPVEGYEERDRYWTMLKARTGAQRALDVSSGPLASRN